ncbi:methylmalonyl-CoA mutase subunit beta [Longispora sp. NPDC051575]|uniref:methylmalonyl-CoA mutase subunit beta n=1 Tax=Longispora sp. NPDC051575 TaxID=3154943 RepID=UPI00342EF962
MTVRPDELLLATGFPTATRDEWRNLAAGVLRKLGKADEETPLDQVEGILATTTYDGVRIAPLYTAEDGAPPTGLPGAAPYTRGARATAGGWDLRQRHEHPDPAVTREAVLADLENGVTSVWLVLGPSGVPVPGLGRVLDGVLLDLAPVVLDAGADTLAAAEAWFALTAGREVAPGGNLGADPLGLRARTGQHLDLDLADLARRCPAGTRAVTVDATVYHDAGGSDAEELGCALATGVAYLRALTGGGLSVEDALGQLEFRYAATADQFLTIAKLRAARRLWSRVAEVCGAAPEARGQRQHAVTSDAMMTARDPWVNMLRTTLAAFAAGVGGADAVTVRPFDARLGLPDGFTRRIARNTQSLLVEESNVARVADPAGGSWYVENLTEDLAKAAWNWFTEIERAGGMAAALDGPVADRLAATWAERRANIARRKDPITGVSEFPNLDEKLPVRDPAPAPRSGGLPRVRYAQDFEALRDRADAHPARPTVFLATLGPVSAHTARASFAANLFAAGGIGTVTGDVADFAASGATVACLCSSDKVYADQAGPAAEALRAAGATRVWLAGRRGTSEQVADYLYAGCDAVAVCDSTLDDLGVAR